MTKTPNRVVPAVSLFRGVSAHEKAKCCTSLPVEVKGSPFAAAAPAWRVGGASTLWTPPVIGSGTTVSLKQSTCRLCLLTL